MVPSAFHVQDILIKSVPLMDVVREMARERATNVAVRVDTLETFVTGVQNYTIRLTKTKKNLCVLHVTKLLPGDVQGLEQKIVRLAKKDGKLTNSEDVWT